MCLAGRRGAASASVGLGPAVFTIKVAEALRIRANGVHQDALHMLAPLRGAFTFPTLEGSTRGSADGIPEWLRMFNFRALVVEVPALYGF